MSENFNSHIACEGTDNDINWVCKVCKDLPNYAGMYLYQREREKNQLKNVKDRRADLILLKYYYALLHLLDKIHELHECPNPENDVPKYADRKCSTPECFVYYRSVMRQNVTILLPVIMHCHRRRWKFIVILDAKPMSSIVKRKHRILPYLWQCYVRKQLLHKTFTSQ